MSTLRNGLSEGHRKVLQAVGGKYDHIVAAEVECLFLNQIRPTLTVEQVGFLERSATAYNVKLPAFAQLSSA